MKLACTLGTLLFSVVACAGEDRPGALPFAPSAATAAGGATVTEPEPEPTPTGADLGGIDIVDVPEGGPCGAPGGSPMTVTREPDAGLTFTRIGRVGSRHFAFGADSSVLVTFSPTETDPPSAILAGPGAVSASEDSLFALTTEGIGYDLLTLNPLAEAVAPPVTVIAEHADAPALAAGPAGTLAAWRSGGAVAGVVYGDAGPEGSFAMAVGSGGEGPCQIAAVADATGFGIVYARHQHNGFTRTTWARIRPDGSILLAKTLLLAGGDHTLTDLVRTETGYVAVLGEGNPTRATVLLPLSEFGEVQPPALRLLGTSLAFGAAWNLPHLAVAAGFLDGRAALRIFDASLAPIGDWICLDDSAPDTGFYPQAGVSADGAGWGLVARMKDGSAAFRRTDITGLAAP